MWLQQYDKYIIEQYLERKRSLLSIATELGCSYQGIAKRLKKAGVCLHSTAKVALDEDYILKEYNQGRTLKDIASGYGLSYQAMTK